MIREMDGRFRLDFDDPEGQRLAQVEDGGAGPFHQWSRSPVPEAFQIRGLGPITISVPDLTPSDRFLTEVMAMRRARSIPDSAGVTAHVYEMGDGGPVAELHVRVEPDLPRARQGGAGGVHHVAFRVRDEEYGYRVARLQRLGIPSSGLVDRFYFRSLYTREPNGILYEIATDGPGFATDEPLDSLGERLSLPLFLGAKPLQGMPVLLGCNDRDPHIPIGRVRETDMVMRALGAEVVTRIYPGGINEDEVGIARQILARMVGAAPGAA